MQIGRASRLLQVPLVSQVRQVLHTPLLRKHALLSQIDMHALVTGIADPSVLWQSRQMPGQWWWCPLQSTLCHLASCGILTTQPR